MSRIKKLIKFLNRLSGWTFVVWILGYGLYVLAALVLLLLSERSLYSQEESLAQTSSNIFWVTLLATLLSLVILNITDGRKPFKSKLFRRVLIFYTLAGFCIGLGYSVWAQIEGENERKSAISSCNLQTSIDTAINGAVYPIRTNLSTGTAFATSADGHLVTAYHVIEDADVIEINFVSGKIPVTVVRTAPGYDLALLKIDQPTTSFLDLSEVYKPSDTVYAVGWPRNAFTAGPASISTGIVSRTIKGSDIALEYEGAPMNLEILQSDTAVNPGNSGGPLVGACGAVGVVTATSDSEQLGEYGFVSEQGISYSVSAKTVKAVLGL